MNTETQFTKVETHQKVVMIEAIGSRVEVYRWNEAAQEWNSLPDEIYTFAPAYSIRAHFENLGYETY